MSDVEARRADAGEFGLDRHRVAEPVGAVEFALRIHHRIAGHIISLEQLVLGELARRRDQHGRRMVEHGEVARIKHDLRRIAVAPFDDEAAGVLEHWE